MTAADRDRRNKRTAVTSAVLRTGEKTTSAVVNLWAVTKAPTQRGGRRGLSKRKRFGSIRKSINSVTQTHTHTHTHTL